MYVFMYEYRNICANNALAQTYSRTRIQSPLPFSSSSLIHLMIIFTSNFNSIVSDWWLKCFSELLWYTQRRPFGCSAASMSCHHVMLCYVMISYYVMYREILCYGMSCHVMSCHTLLFFFSFLLFTKWCFAIKEWSTFLQCTAVRSTLLLLFLTYSLPLLPFFFPFHSFPSFSFLPFLFLPLHPTSLRSSTSPSLFYLSFITSLLSSLFLSTPLHSSPLLLTNLLSSPHLLSSPFLPPSPFPPFLPLLSLPSSPSFPFSLILPFPSSLILPFLICRVYNDPYAAVLTSSYMTYFTSSVGKQYHFLVSTHSWRKYMTVRCMFMCWWLMWLVIIRCIGTVKYSTIQYFTIQHIPSYFYSHIRCTCFVLFLRIL